MIYTPYSHLTTSALNDPTQANFPALKHFWKCNETSGTTITDSVGGVVIPAPNLVIQTNGISTSAAITAATVTGGTLTSPGTKNCILFAVANFGTGGFTYGTSSGGAGNAGFNLGQAQTLSIYDGTNTLAGTAFTAGGTTIYGRAITVNWAGNAVNYEATTTDTISTKAGVATSAATPGTIAGGISAVSQKVTLSNNVNVMYGIAYFQFNGSLPTDIPAAIAWMTYQWANGNKVIYPGWKGVS